MSHFSRIAGVGAASQTAPRQVLRSLLSICHGAAAARRGARPLGGLLITVAACAGTSLLVAACSSAAPQPPGHAMHRPAAARPAFGTYSGAGAAQASAGASRGAELTMLTAPRSIIYTANVTLRVSNATMTARAATSDVAAAGGYVASEQQRLPAGRHGVAQVSLQLKIPVAAYQATLTKLAALGHPLAFSTQAQDVTQQVADVTSRVASAHAAIGQLRTLLGRAGSVSQLLSVQDQINRQESALEALLAQQRALTHETSYGTISLTLVGHHAATRKKPKKKTHRGLAAGLGTGWRALQTAVTWLLTVLGTILPFAAVLALIAAIGYAARRLVRRRPAQTPAPPAS